MAGRDAEEGPRQAATLADRIHEGPVQVLSAAALRLELLARSLDGEVAERVLAVAADVRSAVQDIQRHTNATEGGG